MAGCPYKNFEECPQHNKKGGCEFWMQYTTNRQDADASIEGCAIVLTPLLLIENVNNLNIASNNIKNLQAELSKARVENIKENQANRQQLFSLANGEKQLINPNYNLIKN